MASFKQAAYDLMQQRKAALDSVSAAMDAGNEALIAEKQAEVEALNDKIERALALEKESGRDFGITDPKKDGQKKQSGSGFATAIKSMLAGKSLVEGTDNKGGYIVPEDIETKINTFRTEDVALADLVTTEYTSVESGAKTYRVRAKATGLTETAEAAAATKMDGPTYKRIPWTVKKFMGVLPVSNELLEDSDANVEAEVVNWAGEESRATENKKILEILQNKAATAITGIGDIKTALNVTLGAAYKPYSVILTNDSGLDYLDQLEDKNGRPLLNADPTGSAAIQLRAGASVVKVVVVPDAVLANDTTKIPFIVGSLQDAVLLKVRRGLTIYPTKDGSISGVNAFENDMTLFRLSKRLAAVEVDSNAWVYCQLDTSGE